MNPLLSIRDIAKLLQLSPQSVRSLARRGELRGSLVLGTWKFTEDDVDEYVRSQRRSR